LIGRDFLNLNYGGRWANSKSQVRLCGIPADINYAKYILAIHAKLAEKGDKFSLKDAVELEQQYFLTKEEEYDTTD